MPLVMTKECPHWKGGRKYQVTNARSAPHSTSNHNKHKQESDTGTVTYCRTVAVALGGKNTESE